MRSQLFLIALVACGGASAPAPGTTTPAPARTTVAPDAVPLLDAWAAAAGGRERLARIGRIHEQGRVAQGGLEGRFDRWSTARGERREEVELGTVNHTVQVFDGARGWLVDRNRQVRDLDGPELQEQVAEAYLAASAALLPDRAPGRVSAANGAVVIEPEHGRTLTVTFDPATHLPATLSRQVAEKTRVLKLSDWRDVGGVRLPFTIEDGAGDPRDTEVVHLDRIDLDAPGAPPFARPEGGPRDWRLEHGRTSIPVDLVRGLVVVKATVNGSAPLDFLVDTGAEVTVINSSRLARLGLKPVGNFSGGAGGGDVDVSYLEGVSFTLPGVTLDKQIVTAIPLDALEPLFGHPIDGVLGYDFLSRFVVEVDYAGKRLTLLDPATFTYAGKGEAVPMTLEGSIPSVKATVGLAGRPPLAAQFVVDTGCSCAVSFNAPFTTANKLLETLPKVMHPPAGASRGAGGATQEVYGRIEAVTIGHASLPRPMAGFAQDAVGAMADPESAGLLGGRLWRRFTVTFDYSRKTMWLEPNAQFAESEEAVGTGIVWSVGADKARKLTVTGVMEDSPGAEAGLAVGDELVSLDGAAADELAIEDVELRPKGQAKVVAGKPHVFVVRRGPKQITVTVTPRGLF